MEDVEFRARLFDRAVQQFRRPASKETVECFTIMDEGDQQQADSPKVLVAEDEPLIRMDIAETLTDNGFHVLEASSGSEALQLIDDPDHVVLVITDVNMPGADGVDVALHARARHPDVPVLFVSARPDLLSSPRTPRPYSHLTKPFRTSDLLAKVSALLLGRGK